MMDLANVSEALRTMVYTVEPHWVGQRTFNGTRSYNLNRTSGNQWESDVGVVLVNDSFGAVDWLQCDIANYLRRTGDDLNNVDTNGFQGLFGLVLNQPFVASLRSADATKFLAVRYTGTNLYLRYEDTDGPAEGETAVAINVPTNPVDVLLLHLDLPSTGDQIHATIYYGLDGANEPETQTLSLTVPNVTNLASDYYGSSNAELRIGWDATYVDGADLVLEAWDSSGTPAWDHDLVFKQCNGVVGRTVANVANAFTTFLDGQGYIPVADWWHFGATNEELALSRGTGDIGYQRPGTSIVSPPAGAVKITDYDLRESQANKALGLGRITVPALTADKCLVVWQFFRFDDDNPNQVAFQMKGDSGFEALFEYQAGNRIELDFGVGETRYGVPFVHGQWYTVLCKFAFDFGRNDMWVDKIKKIPSSFSNNTIGAPRPLEEVDITINGSNGGGSRWRAPTMGGAFLAPAAFDTPDVFDLTDAIGLVVKPYNLQRHLREVIGTI